MTPRRGGSIYLRKPDENPMPNPIALAKPNITDAEIEAVVGVLRSGWLSLGPKTAEFERVFCDYCHTKHAVACSSGTSGLHLLIKAMEITAGDEVITTPFSFIASANCVLMEGARPVFVDIDPLTWNIQPDLIEQAVTPRTRAIIPVHVFGQPVDMDPIRAIAQTHELRVIEDACEAFGSAYRGRPAGSLGDAAVFAFYPNKQITTGEGGMIVTNDERLAKLCRSLRNQGRDTDGGWLSHPRLGYNYRLSDIHCAVGLAQLRRIEEILSARRRVEALYQPRLADEPRLVMQEIRPEVQMSRFVFVVRLADEYDPDARDRILTGLRDRGIGCSNYFAPIHLQPFYVERFGFKPGDFPICEHVAARTIALPFHHELTEEDVDTVCRELRRLL